MIIVVDYAICTNQMIYDVETMNDIWQCFLLMTLTKYWFLSLLNRKYDPRCIK